MKKILMLLMLLGITVGVNAQLLWKVSGNGLSKPSYVFGTHHLSPISIVDSIAGFQQMANSVEQVYGELVMSEMANPQNIQKMQQAIVMPGDTTLHTLLSKVQYDSLALQFKQLMGIDLKMMDKVRPAFLSTQVAMVLAMKTVKGFNPQQQLDGWIQAEAQKRGKKVGGLETMDIQINILFNTQSLKRQAEQLYGVVTYLKEGEEQAKKMSAAYMSQNLDQLKQAMDMKLGNVCDALPEEEEVLIYGRNANWIKLMPSLMQAKSTLFAVGAGHLLGERGVLNLLKKQGYIVEPVK